MIERHELDIDRATVVVVDEASMVGTADLRKLLACAIGGRAKIVLVGDAYQLSPVKARGGMFEQLCADLPWSQRLSDGVADARPRRNATRRSRCAPRAAASAPARRRLVPHERPAAHRRSHCHGHRCAGCLSDRTRAPAGTHCWSVIPGRWPTRSTGGCTTPTPPRAVQWFEPPAIKRWRSAI